jgi:uncharacterized protein (TIGR02270 family)
LDLIRKILEQHAEEAAFLWLLRNAATYAPHYTLLDIARLDDRVEAHLDGLRIARDPGWDICQKALKLNETGEIFTASVLSFEIQDLKRMDFVLYTVCDSHELRRAWISAIGWIDYDKIINPIQKLIHSDAPALKYLGLAAHAVHRRDPKALLAQYLHNENSTIRARALQACAEIGRRDLLNEILTHLQDDDPKCRFYAAWSATILGSPHSLNALKTFANQDGPFSEKAALTLIRRMHTAEAHDWLRQIGRKANRIRLAIRASGALGDPAVIPSLLKAMQVPEFARPAGEAFSMITGVDIAYEDLDGDWPDGFEAGPTENPEDDNVEMDKDEDLPWPDHDLIYKWWNDKKQNYRNGTRYLCGKPISVNQCQYVLRHGYQRQRESAALELAMMQPGGPLFPVKAPGFRQQKLLGLK